MYLVLLHTQTLAAGRMNNTDTHTLYTHELLHQHNSKSLNLTMECNISTYPQTKYDAENTGQLNRGKSQI